MQHADLRLHARARTSLLSPFCKCASLRACSACQVSLRPRSLAARRGPHASLPCPAPSPGSSPSLPSITLTFADAAQHSAHPDFSLATGVVNLCSKQIRSISLFLHASTAGLPQSIVSEGGEGGRGLLAQVLCRKTASSPPEMEDITVLTVPASVWQQPLWKLQPRRKPQN